LNDRGEATLPGARTLCAHAGVAYTTMLDALRELHNAGTIFGGPGRAYRVRKRIHPTKTIPLKRSLYRRILDDIASGLYPPGRALPSRKNLCRRYGCSYTTLAKALNNVVSTGLLYPEKRKLIVPGYHRSAAARSTVVCIVCGNDAGIPALPTPRSRENLRTLEAQCSRRNLDLHIVVHSKPSGVTYAANGERISLTAFAHQPLFLGYLFWNAGLGREFSRTLVHTLHSTGKPAAILDENLSLLPTDMPSTATRLFGSGYSADAGVDVASYLLSAGHHAIGYISPVHRPSWSQNRLRGLSTIYPRSGSTSRLYSFTLDEMFPPPPPPTLLDKTLSSLEHDPALAHTLSTHGEFLRFALRDTLLEHRFTQLFEEALGNSAITAWVAANDRVAAAALTFLHKRKVFVPRDISLVGFDDSELAHLHHLTSYNFNPAATINHMINWILDPSRPTDEKQRAPITVSGFITHRHTVRPLPARSSDPRNA